MHMPLVSIIIATKNRYDALLLCLQSIQKSHDSCYEVIIVDQSSVRLAVGIQTFIHKNNRVRYFHVNNRGKSNAINFGIEKSNGAILAFTDDDCIVTKNWIPAIRRIFTNPRVQVVFGNTYPYEKRLHKREKCPSIMDAPTSTITIPSPHYSTIGFGNNMAIRSSIIQRLGTFKPWLGPGSVAKAAMDAEYIIRILTHAIPIHHSQTLVIYHNKWLSTKEARIQDIIYQCGEMACYGYYAWQGYDFAAKILREDFSNSVYTIKHMTKRISLKKAYVLQCLHVCSLCRIRVLGFLIGTYYYFREKHL